MGVGLKMGCLGEKQATTKRIYTIDESIFSFSDTISKLEVPTEPILDLLCRLPKAESVQSHDAKLLLSLTTTTK